MPEYLYNLSYARIFSQREHMFSICGLYMHAKVCVIVLCAVALIRFNQNFGVLNSICFYTFTISPPPFSFYCLFLEGGPWKLNNSTSKTITVPAPVVLLAGSKFSCVIFSCVFLPGNAKLKRFEAKTINLSFSLHHKCSLVAERKL